METQEKEEKSLRSRKLGKSKRLEAGVTQGTGFESSLYFRSIARFFKIARISGIFFDI